MKQRAGGSREGTGSRDAAGEQRREQMLRAALDVIVERGYADTRIADVAERTGTSPALVIYYFKTRDQLLTEAIRYSEDTWYAEYLRRLETIPTAAGPCTDAARKAPTVRQATRARARRRIVMDPSLHSRGATCHIGAPGPGLRSEEGEVVAVHDLALVRRSQLAPQGRRGPPDQPRDLVGVEVDQAARDRPAVGAGEVDRVTGDEGRDPTDTAQQQEHDDDHDEGPAGVAVPELVWQGGTEASRGQHGQGHRPAAFAGPGRPAGVPIGRRERSHVS